MQAAAAECVRALSRSVKDLRLTLCNAGIAEPLVALLAAAQPDVASSACAALCNLVLDFSIVKVLAARSARRPLPTPPHAHTRRMTA